MIAPVNGELSVAEEGGDAPSHPAWRLTADVSGSLSAFIRPRSVKHGAARSANVTEAAAAAEPVPAVAILLAALSVSRKRVGKA